MPVNVSASPRSCNQRFRNTTRYLKAGNCTTYDTNTMAKPQMLISNLNVNWWRWCSMVVEVVTGCGGLSGHLSLHDATHSSRTLPCVAFRRAMTWVAHLRHRLSHQH